MDHAVLDAPAERAVFATSREAVGDEKYFAVTVPLPPDYHAPPPEP